MINVILEIIQTVVLNVPYILSRHIVRHLEMTFGFGLRIEIKLYDMPLKWKLDFQGDMLSHFITENSTATA